MGSDIPLTFAMIGDLGQTNNSQGTLDHVAAHVGKFAAVMHFGDLSYADGNETRWDTWGRLVQVRNVCRALPSSYALSSILSTNAARRVRPSLDDPPGQPRY